MMWCEFLLGCVVGIGGLFLVAWLSGLYEERKEAKKQELYENVWRYLYPRIDDEIIGYINAERKAEKKKRDAKSTKRRKQT